MIQFTKQYVKELEIKSLEEALDFSIDKWKWLSKEKANVLRNLYSSHKICIAAKDCPMCKFMNSFEMNKTPCKCCVLTKVCSTVYDFALEAFSDFMFGLNTISNFRKKARIVRDDIKNIRKAFLGKQ